MKFISSLKREVQRRWLRPCINFVNAGLIPFGFPNTTFVDVHERTPYIYQYNLSLQRQLGAGLVAEANYVGSSSHKLTTQVDENPIVLGTTTRPLNLQPGIQIPNAFGVILADANAANASYNGLLASLTKRMGNWRSIGSQNARRRRLRCRSELRSMIRLRPEESCRRVAHARRLP